MRYLAPVWILLGCLAIAVTGCRLMPKPVEFFQDEVAEPPAVSHKAEEPVRQAAKLAHDKAGEVVMAAKASGSPEEVVAPAVEVEALTGAVSTHLGPPKRDYAGEVAALVAEVQRLTAKIDAQQAAFNAAMLDLAGKKIEGTGAIQMPYLVYLMVVGAAIAVLWTILKIIATVNAPVRVGTAVVEGGARVGMRAAAQLIKGGQEFRARLSERFPDVADDIIEIFKDSHRVSQDTDVQTLVQTLKK